MSNRIWIVAVEWNSGGEPDLRGAYTSEEAAKRKLGEVCAELKKDGYTLWYDQTVTDEDRERDPDLDPINEDWDAWDADVHVVEEVLHG